MRSCSRIVGHRSILMKDNEKKYMLVVQSIRNAIMGSTLMAATSAVLSSSLAAIISSSYSIKKPLEGSVFGAQGEFIVVLKYVAVLLLFLLAFLCYSLSIWFLNQVSFLINIPHGNIDGEAEYASSLLEKGFILGILGSRLFYVALPLLLWIFGPLLEFLCSVLMILILYNMDIANYGVGIGGDNMEVKSYIQV